MRLCVVATCFVAFLVTGCDIDPLGEKADARKREADKRAEQERVRAETASQREAMLQYATGKKKNIQERMAATSKEEAALRADFSKLTAEVARIMSEKDSAGNERIGAEGLVPVMTIRSGRVVWQQF